MIIFFSKHLAVWKRLLNFAGENKKEKGRIMCTITLSYNENDVAANEKLDALLRTGLFVQVENRKDDLDAEKEFYTPEELRSILINDLNEIYGVKDAI